MARKTDKQKAQELVDEVERLFLEAKTPQERKTWAENTLPKMDEAIKLDPNNADAWSDRGVAKNTLGDHQTAIADHNEAIRLNPKDVSIWNNRGGAKSKLGDYKGGIEDCTKAIGLDPNNATTWTNRGGIKNESGDHQGAIEDCTKAIKLNPKNALAWHNRGAAKFRLGKYNNAIKDFDEALGLAPENTDTQQYRQGAEIAKLREEAAKDTLKGMQKSRALLKRQWNCLTFYLICYQAIRAALFIFLFIFTIVYFGLLNALNDLNKIDKLAKKNDNNTDIANLAKDMTEKYRALFSDFSFDFSNLDISEVGILSIIIFPIIWGIRLLNLGIERTKTLRWDLFSRINTEGRIDYYQKELGENSNDFTIAYMNSWINKNPADRLVTLSSKKSAANEKSENETLLQEIKNLLEQLTKRNTKED